MKFKFREPVSGLTHLYSAIAALLGLIYLLIVSWTKTGLFISLLIYGICLVLLFSASAVYHLLDVKPAINAKLRKLDHSAIYLLIAGTYTPICYNMLTGFWQWGMLTIIWAIALIGIVLKMFFMNTPRWFSAGIYMMMGWLCALALPELIRRIPTGGLVWLSVGGVIYTLGAVIYSTRKLDFFPGRFGFHEVWHVFVMQGALAHFILIAVYIA